MRRDTSYEITWDEMRGDVLGASMSVAKNLMGNGGKILIKNSERITMGIQDPRER